MSHKQTEDKSSPLFPWTARQLRNKLFGKRLQRKQLRKQTRNK
jgi:hypothetical protein